MAIADERVQRVYGRIAGFMFLFVTAVHLTGIAIASNMIVPDDFAETAKRIAASEQLYRVALCMELIPSCAAILLAGALYVLLKPVSAHLALFALLWRVASSVLGGVTVLFNFTAVRLYLNADAPHAGGFEETLATLMSRGSGVGIQIAAVFFSISSLIFFWLLLRSRYVPRILSLLGILASILFPIVSFGILIVPAQAATLQFGWAPTLAAETLTGLWLLLAGPSLKSWSGRTSPGSPERTQ